MVNKIVVSALSVFLVVGVVIGAVVSVNKNSGHDGGNKSDGNLTPHMKAVKQFCEPTNYKESCQETLTNVDSTDPKEFIKAGILAISGALKKSLNMTSDIVDQASSEPRGKMAIDDCQELLNEAVKDLQDISSKVGDSDLHTIATNSEDYRTWLSSIITYQELCIDGFEDNSTARATMRNSTDFGNQLTDNVLKVLSQITAVLGSFGLQLNIPTSRRLLQDNGFPTWMSAADRKLLASNNMPKPNAVVASDGSGQYKTIQAAVNAYPKNHQGRYVIYVKAGTYKEYVFIQKTTPNIYMYGDGSRKTIVTGSKSFAKSGLGTWKTATFIVEADGFIAKDMAFENTAGPEGHQAVAIRVKSDKSAFNNVQFDGYQDTLLYQSGRQFYTNCVISGTIDFIFGYGQAVIQNSMIIVRRPMDNQFNTVTADGKKTDGEVGGVVLHNCKIVPDAKLVPDKFKLKTYLGRPWKDFSTTVVMKSQLDGFIQAEGWMPWQGNLFLNTLYYAEFGNTGPGAKTDGRVKWKTLHFLKPGEAAKFAPGAFLQGQSWIPATGVPAQMGL